MVSSMRAYLVMVVSARTPHTNKGLNVPQVEYAKGLARTTFLDSEKLHYDVDLVKQIQPRWQGHSPKVSRCLC
jgi:hypothetical protein